MSLELSCQATYVPVIEKGRSQILTMPRAWVLEHIERVAVAELNLSDYWEYRRLLEIAALLDLDLVQRFVALGLNHPDPDVHEAAEDFKRR